MSLIFRDKVQLTDVLPRRYSDFIWFPDFPWSLLVSCHQQLHQWRGLIKSSQMVKLLIRVKNEEITSFSCFILSETGMGLPETGFSFYCTLGHKSHDLSASIRNTWKQGSWLLRPTVQYIFTVGETRRPAWRQEGTSEANPRKKNTSFCIQLFPKVKVKLEMAFYPENELQDRNWTSRSFFLFVSGKMKIMA